MVFVFQKAFSYFWMSKILDHVDLFLYIENSRQAWFRFVCWELEKIENFMFFKNCKNPTLTLIFSLSNSTQNSWPLNCCLFWNRTCDCVWQAIINDRIFGKLLLVNVFVCVKFYTFLAIVCIFFSKQNLWTLVFKYGIL